MPQPLKIVAIYGSVRTARQGIKAARFAVRQLTERGHDVTLVDPLEVQLPLLDRMYKEYAAGTAPDGLERLATLYRAADAFVIVTGEYNHSAPPALLNLLDHFLEEYFFRPSAILSVLRRTMGWRARGRPAPRDAVRARHAQHLEHVSRREDPIGVCGRRRADRPGDAAAVREIRIGARVVRGGAEGATEARRAVLGASHVVPVSHVVSAFRRTQSGPAEAGRYKTTVRRRSAFAMTDTELRVIAALAQIGLMSTPAMG